MESILEFCDRCILLENGQLIANGSSETVVDQYLELSDMDSGELREVKPADDTPHVRKENLRGLQNESVTVNSLRFWWEPLTTPPRLYTDTAIHLVFTCEKRTSDDSFELTCYLKNLNEIRVLMDSFSMRRNYTPKPMAAGVYEVECIIPANLLSRGIYSLGVILGRNDVFSKEVEEVARFKVYPQEEVNWNHAAASVVRPHLEWKIISPEEMKQ
jgi:ABC-type glutathione transport system ATPase component